MCLYLIFFQASFFASQKSKKDDPSEKLSFVDFLKSLPIFHSVNVTELARMERDCPSAGYRYLISMIIMWSFRYS